MSQCLFVNLKAMIQTGKVDEKCVIFTSFSGQGLMRDKDGQTKAMKAVARWLPIKHVHLYSY